MPRVCGAARRPAEPEGARGSRADWTEVRTDRTGAVRVAHSPCLSRMPRTPSSVCARSHAGRHRGRSRRPNAAPHPRTRDRDDRAPAASIAWFLPQKALSGCGNRAIADENRARPGDPPAPSTALAAPPLAPPAAPGPSDTGPAIRHSCRRLPYRQPVARKATRRHSGPEPLHRTGICAGAAANRDNSRDERTGSEPPVERRGAATRRR